MQKTSCAIMFADISGSTSLYDQKGDDAAKRIIDQCLGRLQIIVETYQGIVVKKIGDELMCRFDSAEASVSAARVAQSEVKNMTSLDQTSLSIRAGIHFGEVIEDDDDIFGDAVNVAARMAGIAKGGQIITTAETVAALPETLHELVRQVDITRVKGKQEKLAVYEVMWEKSGEVTRVATELLSRSASKPTSLKLQYGDSAFELKDESVSVTIGRDDSCDLVVPTALASRQHAHCELRRGKFIIVDQGTNGTYVAFAGGEEVYLRREELVLRGKGVISLGKPSDESGSEDLICFEC